MALNKTTRNAIDDSAITTEKIEDGAVTAGKLAAGDLSISKTLLLNAAPTISSLNTSQINPDSGATVTITGTGFVSIPDVKFLNTSTGVRIQASTIGFTSSTTITAAFPSGQTPGTYKVLVENADGQGVLSTASIIYSIAPTWSTAANLGSVEEGESVNISLVAYDDDSTAVTSYTLVSGSLPSGVTLSGDSTIGTLTGTAPAVDADTNYTFTIRATDDESQTSDREFTLTITNWTVANSLRFDRDSNDKLTRTLGTPTNQNKFTISFWIKLARFANGRYFFSIYTDSSNETSADIQNDNSIRFYDYSSTSYTGQYITSRVLRDPSAWYHLVFVYDSGNATAGNRIRIYINGTEETNFSTESNPSLNENSQNTSGAVFNIGDYGGGGYGQSGYMAEFCFIDGQALDPTSFGETDTASGIWKPKSVSGLTFGTNGFYLPFTSSGSLGADSSGNGNNFTVNNLTAIDQTTDTPTNNYSTWNPLDNYYAESTFSEGNLKVRGKSPGIIYSYETYNIATIGISSGKWYWEVKYNATDSGAPAVGIVDGGATATSEQLGARTYGWSYGGGSVENNGSSVGGTFSSYSVGDIIGIALNLDDNELTFYKNGTVQNGGTAISITAPANTTSGFYFPAGGDYNAGNVTWEANFGNPPFTISSGNSDANGYGNFEYAVPSGYFALNTKNLAEYG
jgi:hypothetical protein